MTTVLITGSEGNIGTYITRQLKEVCGEWEVVRFKHAKGSTFFDQKLSMYYGDLRDPACLDYVFCNKKIDYVIHAASTTYNTTSMDQVPFDIANNDIQSLAGLLGRASSVKKIVYLSSALLYESAEESPFLETKADTILPPKSPYGLAKFISEQMLKLFHRQTNVPYTIWRPFNVVSPIESHRQYGGHVFVDFYRSIFVEQLPALRVAGNGRQERCFVWVEDVAKCIVENITNIKTDNQVFNIGSAEPHTLLELIDVFLMIGKKRGLLDKSYQPDIVVGNRFSGVDSQRRIASLEKIDSQLGWKASTDFITCFEKFIEYKELQ